MKYDERMDKECIKLCDAMNLIEGITTIESCCGHGTGRFAVSFVADSLAALPNLLYWFDACHSGERGWGCIVTTDCAKSPVHFHIDGPVGAYDAANRIANLIELDAQHIKEDHGMLGGEK